MSIHFSRYSKMYSKLPRPDVAHSFPRLVFQREPNAASMKLTSSGHLIVKQ